MPVGKGVEGGRVRRGWERGRRSRAGGVCKEEEILKAEDTIDEVSSLAALLSSNLIYCE